jgi:hypothetical protein
VNLTTNDEAEKADKKERTITIKLNGHTVIFQEHKVNGIEIKRAGIAQGVPNIQEDFVLFKVNHGGKLKPIGDAEEISIHDNEEFRAIAPDDNS